MNLNLHEEKVAVTHKNIATGTWEGVFNVKFNADPTSLRYIRAYPYASISSNRFFAIIVAITHRQVAWACECVARVSRFSWWCDTSMSSPLLWSASRYKRITTKNAIGEGNMSGGSINCRYEQFNMSFQSQISIVRFYLIAYIHFHSRLWWMCVKYNINEIKLACNGGGKKLRFADNLRALIYQSAANANILAPCRNCWKAADCSIQTFFGFFVLACKISITRIIALFMTLIS